MLKIQRLFEATKNDTCEKLEHLTHDCVPEMTPPETNSKEFKKDIDAVIFSYRNPALKSGFLDTSHRSVKEVFKAYCGESGYKINWKQIKSLLADLKSVNSSLKNKHRRPRPKAFLLDMSDSYKKIHDMSSFSFPSGHTSEAYFLAGIIGALIPEARADLENIAMLIGQSRIENAVHYPSDVHYGRLVGESCANFYIQNNHSKKSNFRKIRKKKHNKLFANHLRSDSFKAAKNLMTSLDDAHMSKNPLVASQCRALRESFYLGTYSPEACIRIHQQFDQVDLEKGTPGQVRSYPHKSPAGVAYCDHDKIFSSLRKIENCEDPILRHALYEWIHPFCDGNGRTGRVILCADLDYDFESVNSIIKNNYIKNLNKFYELNKIEKYFE